MEKKGRKQGGLAPLLLVIILAVVALLMSVAIAMAAMYIGYLGKGDPASWNGESADELEAGGIISQPACPGNVCTGGCDPNWWGGVSSETWGSLGKPNRDVVGVALLENDKCYGSDRVPYNNYRNNQWCAAFAVWCYNQAGYKVPLIENSQRLLRWFKNNGHHVHRDPAKAQPGEIIVWTKGGSAGHTAIVVANHVDEKLIKTIEGNVKGNCVRIRSYTYQQILGRYNGLVGFAGW